MATNLQQYLNDQYQDVKVLYVEEEKLSREKLLRVLKRRFANVYVAIDYVEGFQLYQRYQPDLIICDIKMNQMSGLELINKIRALNVQVQVIATSAYDEHDFFFQSDANKINHFIFKPIDLEQLLHAIQKSVYQIQLEKEPIDDILEMEIRRAERLGQPFSIILMDIDFFNHVNECFGQQAGDTVLHTISTIVQLRIRESDIFARWGGEEFILLTTATDRNGAQELAESIRSIIEDFKFII
ncbi:diguanylate cyclase [Priestia megaterium]|uniref:Diguanylate cyclase n=1 Tax=Priestia megaterium TaxID=1404 RepID=A0A6H1P5K2_PRIMG|nr:diguanylate cyclase [Priestia megaterium]QIZ08798.1 diguanylate cyclase [Priestia megaterium]